jgi:hypothetical protein
MPYNIRKLVRNLRHFKKKDELIERINSYLGNGGLFNPELMDHEKVRDLMVDIRDYFECLPNSLIESRDALGDSDSQRANSTEKEV